MLTPASPVYSVEEITVIEQKVIPDAVPSLMERAGRVAAQEAIRLAQHAGTILIACGPGNNGGDGFVMGRLLMQAGRDVIVAFAASPDKLPSDAAKAWADYVAAGGLIVSDLPAAPANQWALVVDALFGTGLKRAVAGCYRNWIVTLNAQPGPRLAVDIPSGLNADTGRLQGITFNATHTVTFIALKPGLITLDGPDYCGDLSVHRLDINPEAWLPARGYVIRPSLFQDALCIRPRNTHKGLHGDVGILGGDRGMIGAALLAGRAALWLGAGRVFVALMDPEAPGVDLVCPELMLRRAAGLPERLTALAVGPGLGCQAGAMPLLEAAIERDIPLVLDADALNLLGRCGELRTLLAGRSAPTVLTPHPAEAARMLGTETEKVQDDRLAITLELAKRFRAFVVLKGCGSIVATPDGRWYINTSGHPGMATAGMGDVLTGLIVSLLAQGWSAENALIAAVHLHGAAADQLAAEGVGPIGLSAGEVAPCARRLLNEWLSACGKDCRRWR